MTRSGLQQPLWKTPLDGYLSPTSDEQVEVEGVISELLAPHRAHAPSSSAKNDKLKLNRRAHLAFLRKNLDALPGSYIAFDSNRSWLLYWAFHGHDLLGAPWGASGVPQSAASLAQPHGDDTPDDSDRRRAVETLLSFQNAETGGFGGGVGQVAHLMASYAAVSALAIVGQPGQTSKTASRAQDKAVVSQPGCGWDEIDRLKMYTWLLSLKQPDGSFVVHHGGEVDVRASYCVLCISLLLGICTPELIDGMGAFIARCQTYEGGLAAGAWWDSLGNSHQADAAPAQGEAHGGYAHCALASHLMLQRLQPGLPPSAQRKTQPRKKQLNIDAALRWAVSQQGIAIEGGAFRGRTNKLVDGCYGWFSGGGMFGVLEAALMVEGKRHPPAVSPVAGSDKQADAKEGEAAPKAAASDSSDSWSTDEEATAVARAPSDSYLYDRVSLQDYILLVAQVETGGLRDKPGKRPDAYHTCYNLSGLSLAQHRLLPCEDSVSAFKKMWKRAPPAEGSEAGPDADVADAWRAHCYAATLAWREDLAERLAVGGDENMLTPTHPVLNIAFLRAKTMMDYFYGQG